MKKYILAIDQGTTSSRAILFDRHGLVKGIEQKETPQIFPSPGCVEQDASIIWTNQLGVIRRLIKNSGVGINEIAGIGITNQRETTVVWDRITGEPVYNAIIWQDNRTAAECLHLRNNKKGKIISAATGLIVDSYFSASKLKWILSNVKGALKRAEQGDLLFGTIDSFLAWKLSGGKMHITDYSNASRTMLFNIKNLDWDPQLLDIFGVPKSMLPKVVDSSGELGYTDKKLIGSEIPISGIAGDQQAALYGHCCFKEGMAKNTYGTGCFMLMNIGSEIVQSHHHLLTTIAWGIEGRITYALEGSVFVAGAAIQWIRDKLGLIKTAEESEKIAATLEANDGVYMVPAFSGLGAPHWVMEARGIICGLTGGTGSAHIIRAALESMAYQTRDVLTAMENDSGVKLTELRVDGGAAANNFLMQFQSDILGIVVRRPEFREMTALGAAMMAGLGIGFWKSSDIQRMQGIERKFSPSMSAKQRKKYYDGWLKSLEMVKAST